MLRSASRSSLSTYDAKRPPPPRFSKSPRNAARSRTSRSSAAASSSGRIGRGALGLDRLLVHERVVEVGDLHGVGVITAGRGQLLDDGVHVLLGLVGQLHERPPAGAVGGDVLLVEPASVDVSEEVVLGPDGEVHARAGVVEDAHDRQPNGWPATPAHVRTDHGATCPRCQGGPGGRLEGVSMRQRRAVRPVVVVVLGVVAGLAAPSLAGPPGKWTVISGGGLTNIVEPGMYRTADGTLHVAMQRKNSNFTRLHRRRPHLRDAASSPAAPTRSAPGRDVTERPGAGRARPTAGCGWCSVASARRRRGRPVQRRATSTASPTRPRTVWTLASDTTPGGRRHHRLRELRRGRDDAAPTARWSRRTR